MRKYGAARPENYSLLTTDAFNYLSIHNSTAQSRGARGVVVFCDPQVDNDNIYMSRLGQINLLMSWLLDLILYLPCYGGGYARTICLHVYCPYKQWRRYLLLEDWTCEWLWCGWRCYRIDGREGWSNNIPYSLL